MSSKYFISVFNNETGQLEYITLEEALVQAALGLVSPVIMSAAAALKDLEYTEKEMKKLYGQ